MVTAARCFVIAEAGVNHNGSEELALKLVDAAKQAGADAVKFQTFRAETLSKPGVQTTDYQKQQTGEADQLAMLKKLELSRDAHVKLKKRCDELKLEFLSTPFDQSAADFLVGLGVPRLKVPSGELTNHPFIAHLSKKNVPLIISTGMATLEEVRETVEVVRATREHCGFSEPLETRLTLLHCTSNYPARPEDVNLNAMLTMKQELGLPIGYSDHTAGIHIAPVAVALGAKVIEKHFTLDRKMEGPDHAASLEPNELKAMIENIRAVEEALGSFEKKPTATELPVRDVVRKSVTLNRPVRKGEVLNAEDLALLRPGTGVPPENLDKVVGRRVKSDFPKWHTLNWSDLES